MNITTEINEIFEKLPLAFVPDKAEGVQAIVQLNLVGPGASQWQLRIFNSQLTVLRGTPLQPDLQIEMPAADYVAISKGNLNAMKLFMNGGIKVDGNVSLAMKFPEWFDRSRVP